MIWVPGTYSQSGAAPDAYDGRVTEIAETLRIAIAHAQHQPHVWIAQLIWLG